MILYKVFCENVEIGLLEINEQGQHRYTPIPEHVKLVKNSIMPFYEMVDGQDWGSPIPILKNRIENAKRFGTEKDISSHTDSFRLVMVDRKEVQ